MPSAESQKIGHPSTDQCVRFGANFVMNYSGLRVMSKESMDFWMYELNAGTAVIYAARYLESEYVRLRGFELYQHPDQKNANVCLSQTLDYLSREGLLNRTFSKDDEKVQGWIKTPDTYPNELKGITIVLRRDAHREDQPILRWIDGRVQLLYQASTRELSNVDYFLVKPA